MAFGQGESASVTGVHVVLANDHDRYRAGLQRALERSDAVAGVTSVATGEEAVKAILDERPAVALLDVRIADLDAVEIHARVRDEDPELAERVIAVSAEPQGERATQFRSVTGRAILDKAAPRRDLVSAVERLARRHATANTGRP